MTLQEMLDIAMRYRNKQSDALIIACFDAARDRNEHLCINKEVKPWHP